MNIFTKILLLFLIILALFLAGFYFVASNTQLLNTKIDVESSKNIEPSAPIVINFSVQVIPSAFEKSIEIFPQENFEISWENSNRQLIITPQKFWKPETDYRIILPEFKNIFFVSEPEKEIIFSVINYPQIESFLPVNGAKDIIFDIEDPVVVSFDRPLEGFFARFTVEPGVEMVYENNPERTQFKLLPKDKIEDGREYKFKIEIKYKKDSDENYKKIYESSFTTLPLLPQNWDKDFTLRLKQAKKYTRSKIKTGKYIDVNLTGQIMTIFENGILLDAFMISSGKRGMETPKGEYTIRNKSSRVWSKLYGLYMPYWMAVVPDGKFGIHELPEWPGGYKEGAAHLGIPVSHGCMRLGVGPAQRVFEWAEIGTPVIIY